jgi:hypothetical protein
MNKPAKAVVFLDTPRVANLFADGLERDSSMPVNLSYRRCSAHKESLYLYAKKTMVDVAPNW